VVHFSMREDCEQYEMLHFGVTYATCEWSDEECLGTIETIARVIGRRRKCLDRQRSQPPVFCALPITIAANPNIARTAQRS
jgi:hypothetical protein